MNPKKKCPKCGRRKRTKCFSYNPIIKEEVCRMCHKSIGTNKFYNPHKQISIGNFSMTDDERKVLARTNGWERVNRECKGLKKIKKIVMRKKRQDRNNKMNKQKESKQLNKKFVEGLK